MGTSSQEWKLSNTALSSSDSLILSFSSSLFPSASGSLNQQNETPSCLSHAFLLSSWSEWFRQGHIPSPAEAPLMNKHRKESKKKKKIIITGHMGRQNCSKKGRGGGHRFLLIKLSYCKKISQDCSFRSSEGIKNKLWLPFPETRLSWSVSFLFLSKPHYDNI